MLSRCQKTLKVNIPYRGSDGPLHLLIDSTGIKVEGEGEWNARKHGGTKHPVWRKNHIGIDEKSLEIRAAECTTSDVGDAPMLPELLDQIPLEQEVATVTAAVPLTPVNATTPLRPVAPPQSFRPARTPNPGNPTPLERSPATISYGHPSASAGPSGDNGAGITAEAAPRPECIASGSWASAYPRASSTDRLPSSRSVCRPQWLHRARHPRHASRRINLSGDRDGSAIRRFAQQSLIPCIGRSPLYLLLSCAPRSEAIRSGLLQMTAAG